MKKLIWGLILAGGATGAYFLFRTPPRQKLITEIADLIQQEAIRQGQTINRAHLEAALERFKTGTLKVFKEYVTAFIQRDLERFKELIGEVKTIIVPVIREAREWDRYEQFIFPG